MREFDVTFTQVRTNRQAGTMVMRETPFVAKMKLPSNMATLGTEPGSRAEELSMLASELWQARSFTGRIHIFICEAFY